MSVGVGVWLPAATGIIGAILGTVASFIPSLILERSRTARESQNLRAALFAEIRALMKISEERRYLPQLRQACEYLATQAAGTKLAYAVRVPQCYAPVYQANCHRIGEIRQVEAAKIVMFYQFVDAVVQDVLPGGPLADGGELIAFQETSRILERALDIGGQLVGRT